MRQDMKALLYAICSQIPYVAYLCVMMALGNNKNDPTYFAFEYPIVTVIELLAIGLLSRGVTLDIEVQELLEGAPEVKAEYEPVVVQEMQP